MPFDSEITTKSKDLIVLEKARALIARGWCQMAYERTDGSVCGTGAIHRVIEGPSSHTQYEVALGHLGFRPGELTIWNDETGRTQAEVVALFDVAIARLSSQ